MTREKWTLLKDTAVYSAAGLIAQNISFVLAVYIRRVLGPEAMGVWALLQVFLNYVAYANLGMLKAIGREVPLLRAKGASADEIEKTKSAGFTYIFLSSIAMGAFLSAGAFIFRSRLPGPLFYGVLFIAVMNVFERANNYAINLLYAEKKFILASVFKLVSAVVNALLVALLAWKFHLAGFFAAMLLSLAFNLAYLVAQKAFTPRLILDAARIKGMLKLGVPLFLMTLSATVFNSIDRIAVGRWLGLKELGVYSLATLATGFLFLLPNNFQTVLYPSLIEKFGGGDEAEKRKYVLKPMRLTTAYFLLFIGLAWIAAPHFTRIFLPQYTNGVPALKMMLFGAAFLALAQPLVNILIALGKPLVMVPLNLGLAGAAYVISGILVRSGWGLLEIAHIISAAYFASYVILMFLALGGMMKNTEILKEVALHAVPLWAATAILRLLDHAGDSILAAAVHAAVFAALWGVFLVLGEKHYGAIGVIRSLIESRARGRSFSSISTTP